MKKYCLVFYLLASFFSCEASEYEKDVIFDEIFLSYCEGNPSYNELHTERLNLILLMNPSCFPDEKINVPLGKLQATIEIASFRYMNIEKKILFTARIRDEKKFFEKPIKLREIFVREIYDAAEALAKTQIFMLSSVREKRFEIELRGYPMLCEFKNGKIIYHEGFMK